MGNRSKYKKLTDLYTPGKEVVFEDGTVMWLQVMNPFEVDDARKDAQAARGRLTNALKAIGSQDFDAVMGSFLARGKENAISDLVNAKSLEWYIKAQQEIEVDPEWTERMAIIERTSEESVAVGLEPAEKEYLATINNEWLAEIDKRLREEQEYQRGHWERMSEAELLEEYREVYLDKRGNDLAVREYNLTEMYYGCRVCDAAPDEDGHFSADAHKACNHKERVFETKEEVRELPEELVVQIRTGFDALSMSVRDARFSRRQGSSSDSSPLPSEAEASTLSIPDETPASAPGTSPQLSLTR